MSREMVQDLEIEKNDYRVQFQGLEICSQVQMWELDHKAEH